MKPTRTDSLFAALICSLFAITFSTQGEAGEACDRGCLLDVMHRYQAALVAHDPDRMEIADHVRFVENIAPTAVGNGFWQTASGLPKDFGIYAADPVAGQVGFLGVMQENGHPVEIAIRLKLQDGKITEIEHLIDHEVGEKFLPNLQETRPAFSQSVPDALRDSRVDMKQIASSYYKALVQSDGDAAPFADDCERHENGMRTAGGPRTKPEPGHVGILSCHDQLETGIMSYIKRIEPVRVEIVDTEKGLVFAFSQFRHPMKQKYVDVTGVPDVKRVMLDFDPFDLPAAHMFKIYDGKLHEIEAMGFMAPYDAPTGWE